MKVKLETAHYSSDHKACYNCVSSEGRTEYDRHRQATLLSQAINNISDITGVDPHDILSAIESVSGPKPDLFRKYQNPDSQWKPDGHQNVFEQDQSHPYID